MSTVFGTLLSTSSKFFGAMAASNLLLQDFLAVLQKPASLPPADWSLLDFSPSDLRPTGLARGRSRRRRGSAAMKPASAFSRGRVQFHAGDRCRRGSPARTCAYSGHAVDDRVERGARPHGGGRE